MGERFESVQQVREGLKAVNYLADEGIAGVAFLTRAVVTLAVIAGTVVAAMAMVAVVAAGATGARFAVEDFVAAGAVIDALAEVGIDYTSPEAAAAAGAWAALRNAGSHVLSASVAGQEFLATGGSLDAAREAWSAAGIRVLREFGGTL